MRGMIHLPKPRQRTGFAGISKDAGSSYRLVTVHGLGGSGSIACPFVGCCTSRNLAAKLPVTRSDPPSIALTYERECPSICPSRAALRCLTCRQAFHPAIPEGRHGLAVMVVASRWATTSPGIRTSTPVATACQRAMLLVLRRMDRSAVICGQFLKRLKSWQSHVSVSPTRRV